jgi:SAM-dependent methyltransferase
MKLKGQSDRLLASIFGVSHPTIGTWRREFESTGKLLPVEEFESVNGKTFRRPTAMYATTSASQAKATKILNDLGDHAPGRTLSPLMAGILATKVRREEVDHQTLPLKPPPRVKLYEGRFQDVAKKIKDGSVDCIFTDPLYSKEWVERGEWEDLARLASRVLKPGGLFVSYSGVTYLDKVLAALGSTGLTYLWTVASLSLSQKNRNYHRRVLNSWKPIVIFGKGVDRLPEGISDVIEGTGLDKKHHEFEQAEADAEYLMSRLVPKGGVVLDCCCGSGTTLVVARRLKLTAVGIDCDPAALALTRARLGCREAVAASALG